MPERDWINRSQTAEIDSLRHELFNIGKDIKAKRLLLDRLADRRFRLIEMVDAYENLIIAETNLNQATYQATPMYAHPRKTDENR
jgi:dynactin complex subunit